MKMNRIEWEALLHGWIADRTLLRADIDLPPVAARLFVRVVAVPPRLRFETDDGRADIAIELLDSFVYQYGDPMSIDPPREGVGNSLTISFAGPGRIVLAEVTDIRAAGWPHF